MSNNLEFWLNEIDAQGVPQPEDAVGVVSTDATSQTPDGPPSGADPNIANQDKTANQVQKGDVQDVNNDPHAPEMPPEKEGHKDFLTWKSQFIKESTKGDTNKSMEMLLHVRDREGLSPEQRKFVEDNWAIQLIRQNANVDKASRQIRNEIRRQLDRNNPSTSVLNYMTAVLETIPTLNSIFIKLNGYGSMKGDLHRKYIGALLGAVQVGSGGQKDDLEVVEKEYNIELSTRFNSSWGEVMLGNWSLKEDDPERFLAEPELKKLQEGSPEEKTALRHRVVIESIAEMFETRAFIIHVVGEDGTLYGLGWDVAGSLRAAFTAGKLKVVTRTSENSEAMIDADGNIVPLVDLSIKYVKPTGGQDEDGQPETDDKRFLERRDGMIFLVADLQLVKEAATALQGASFKEIPHNGNPSDLKTLIRCVYQPCDLLLRSC